MWSKIKSAFAWIGGILLAALGVVAGLFFLSEKRKKEAELLASAEKAQAALDEKMDAKIETANAQADAQIAEAEALHAQNLSDIKEDADKKAAELAGDLSALAAALDSKGKRDA